MSDLDKLLSELKSEFQPEKSPTPPTKNNPSPSSSPLDHLLHNVKQELEHQKPTTPSSVGKITYDTPNPLLEQLKQELSQEEKQRQQQQQEEEKAQKLRLDQQRQQQKKALEAKATQWLKQLNPNSEEGLWFEEFAYSYESKLVAAIDYLQAMNL